MIPCLHGPAVFGLTVVFFRPEMIFVSDEDSANRLGRDIRCERVKDGLIGVVAGGDVPDGGQYQSGGVCRYAVGGLTVGP